MALWKGSIPARISQKAFTGQLPLLFGASWVPEWNGHLPSPLPTLCSPHHPLTMVFSRKPCAPVACKGHCSWFIRGSCPIGPHSLETKEATSFEMCYIPDTNTFETRVMGLAKEDSDSKEARHILGPAISAFLFRDQRPETQRGPPRTPTVPGR